MGYFYQDSANLSLSYTATYTYDSLNRLTNAVATGNSTYNLAFIYAGGAYIAAVAMCAALRRGP